MLSRLITVREQMILLGLGVAMILGAVSLHLYHREVRPPVEIDEPDALLVRIAVAPPQTGAIPTPIPSVAPDDTAVSIEARADWENPTLDVGLLGVAAMGAVNREGLYYLSPGGHVKDLLELAGGATPDADLRYINLAASLIDATTLTVPRKPVIERDGDRISYRKGQPGAAPNPPQYTMSGARAMPPSPAPNSSQYTVSGAPATQPVPAPSVPSRGTSGALNLNTATAAELEALPGIGAVLSQRIVEYRTHIPFARVDDLRNVHGIGDGKLAAIRTLVTVR